ncbi:MAG: metallophosphoesterase [Myxococcales bacterium]|nr:metallophosphoesterase [Myxococcales bacterium]
MLTLALVTDLHFGPKAHFDGKLRKLSWLGPSLCADFVARMRDEVRPDLVVNLGDVVEDESREADERRYLECLELLRRAPGRLVCVAGNHDRVNLDPPFLLRAWGEPAAGPLHRSFDLGGVHFVVLYTHERKDEDVTLPEGALAWLAADLAASTAPAVILMHHSAADQDLRGNRWFAKAPHICLVKERRELRRVLREHGRTMAVFNGHLHWNHLDLIDGIPYVTLQSLVENVTEDAPGVAAAAHAVVRLGQRRMVVEVAGAEPCRYQLELGRS